jgi:hypothetical protein
MNGACPTRVHKGRALQTHPSKNKRTTVHYSPSTSLASQHLTIFVMTHWLMDRGATELIDTTPKILSTASRKVIDRLVVGSDRMGIFCIGRRGNFPSRGCLKSRTVASSSNRSVLQSQTSRHQDTHVRFRIASSTPAYKFMHIQRSLPLTFLSALAPKKTLNRARPSPHLALTLAAAHPRPKTTFYPDFLRTQAPAQKRIFTMASATSFYDFKPLDSGYLQAYPSPPSETCRYRIISRQIS